MTHVLMALAGLAGYVAFLVIHPDKPCRRCRGWGARGRRRKSCPRCGGTGTRFRLGARVVHRGAALVMRHAAERLRERRD